MKVTDRLEGDNTPVQCDEGRAKAGFVAESERFFAEHWDDYNGKPVAPLAALLAEMHKAGSALTELQLDRVCAASEKLSQPTPGVCGKAVSEPGRRPRHSSFVARAAFEPHRVGRIEDATNTTSTSPWSACWKAAAKAYRARAKQPRGLYIDALENDLRGEKTRTRLLESANKAYALFVSDVCNKENDK